jgi:molybdopterin-guanine dinucleotide biosynthesis protein A
MFGDRTILELLIAELQRGFDDIAIIAAPEGAEPFPIESLLRTCPSSVRLLRDQTVYQGPAVALAGALAVAANDIAFACSCDLPFLRVAVARALCEILNGYEAVIPQLGDKPQPLCAVYRRSVAAALEMQLAAGERRLTRTTAGLTAHRPGVPELRQIDPDLRSFINVNTAEDYERALALKQSLESES